MVCQDSPARNTMEFIAKGHTQPCSNPHNPLAHWHLDYRNQMKNEQTPWEYCAQLAPARSIYNRVPPDGSDYNRVKTERSYYNWGPFGKQYLGLCVRTGVMVMDWD